MARRQRNWVAIILAAGLGKRMRSRQPKVVHRLAGRPLVCYVVDAARAVGIEACLVVVGQGEDQVRAALGDAVSYIRQPEALGTAHALAQAEPLARNSGHLVVLNGDVPLLTGETLAALMAVHLERQADLSFLTACVADAEEYGQVRRDATGRVVAVVEAAERQGGPAGQAEINGGIYCFRAAWVWPRLPAIPRAANGEYYLTDLVGMAAGEGAAILALPAPDPDEVRGINDRAQLAQAEQVMRERIRRRHMLAGVTIADPVTTYIDADVLIGEETVLHPNTVLAGSTSIGPECEVGPGSIVRDSTVGPRCKVVASVLEGATLEEGVDVGPFSHLRPGAYLCRGVHVGNFAEVKNARLGPNTKMGHFGYIGDADVGADVNIGAGTITCNFDGVRKHRTVIGDGAFIGSDTMLVAPVTVGAGARTGAGSVVNHDVPPGATAVGAPARLVRRRRAGRPKKGQA